jgi:hypothetical protein
MTEIPVHLLLNPKQLLQLIAMSKVGAVVLDFVARKVDDED